MNKLLLLILFLVSFKIQAQLFAPSLHVTTKGLKVSLSWSANNEALGYKLLYAPYPYQGEQTIKAMDMGDKTSFTVDLWQGATFYVAIQAYDINHQNSSYSNIRFFQIQNKGDEYQLFWQKTIEDINEKVFITDEFLYTDLPNVESCFSGSLTDKAKKREIDVLNQIRKLHQLSIISYDDNANDEVQQSALIQRANNFLSHTPSSNALCYTQEGYNGSSSSNLQLSSSSTISDPADDLISFIDDAFNVSMVAAVGHRRALLNPFMKFSSYGQVLGASAVKVFGFADSLIPNLNEIPDYIAFPYLRYPYVFFSDKTHNQKTPWSLSIVENKLSKWENQHEYFTNAQITVKQKDNEKYLTVGSIHTDTNASGVPNLLSWLVDDWQYDTWYTVSIKNIDYQFSNTNNITYDVFIDYKNFINISFPLEEGDQKNGRVIQGNLFGNDDKDSFKMNLGGITNFSGKSQQFSNMAYFISIYNEDKQLLISKDINFNLDLPNGNYIIVISNCNEKDTCYSQPKNYLIQVN